MKDLKIRIRDFDKVLKQALAQTYSYSPYFKDEYDFKHELFHQLHGMEIDGYTLGNRLPGHKTCMLHAEAKPINGMRGNNSYVDLLVCNPTIQCEYSYKTEIAIELKKSLNESELRKEIEKFSHYRDSVRKLYIASANNPKIDRATAKRIVSKHKLPSASIEVLDRSSVPYTSAPQSLRRSRAKTTLADRVAKCVKDTLNLYGHDLSDRFHNFFWRNWEHETEKPWTFPSEKDFVAQLYHRLRTRLKQSVAIHTEYHPPSTPPRTRVDIFVEGAFETVGIEVKMNYNTNNCANLSVVKSLSQKFDAMSDYNANHANFLVVIQGQDGYGANAKQKALSRLRQTGSKVSLLYYAEHDNEAIGPVSVEEAQELATRI